MVSGKKKTLKKAVIPATANYKGYTLKVTAVGAKAFKSMKKLTKVTFGKNVTSVGKNAFYKCKKLKTIKFKNVKTIYAGAFSGCKALKKLPLVQR